MVQPAVRCVEFVEQVSDWFEGGLPDDDRVQFEEHLAFCTGCGDYVDQFRIAIALVDRTRVAGSPPSEAPPPAARAALLDAFRRTSKST